MAHDALAALPRFKRKMLLNDEAARRKSGKWGNWETLQFPAGSAGNGFAREFTIAHRNSVFSVLDRTLSNGVRHLAVSSLSGTRPTWPEMQRIKDELAGEEATAVEVYPPRSEIIDQAPMYHIWILTEPLNFSLKDPRP